MTINQHFNCLNSSLIVDSDERKKNSPCNIWIPSADVFCVKISKPTTPKKHWDDVIPWQIEDLLVRPVEDYVYSWQHNASNDQITVRAVLKEAISLWENTLLNHTLVAQSMVADYFALDVNDSGWSAYVHGDNVIVRLNASEGFGTSLEFFWQLLAREFNRSDSFSLRLKSEQSFSLPDYDCIRSAFDSSKISVNQGKVLWRSIEPPKQFSILNKHNYSALSSNSAWSMWFRSAVLAVCLMAITTTYMHLATNKYDQSSVLLSDKIEFEYSTVYGHSLKSDWFIQTQASESSNRALALEKGAYFSNGFSILRRLDDFMLLCRSCAMVSLSMDEVATSVSFRAPEHTVNDIKETLLIPGIEVSSITSVGTYTIEFPSDIRADHEQ